MIVPTTRNAAWAALVALPALGLWPHAPGALPWLGGLLVLWALLPLFDLALGPRQTGRLTAEAPARLRAVEGREAVLEVALGGLGAGVVACELAWPRSLTGVGDNVFRVSGEGRALLKIGFIPAERGSYDLTRLHLELGSRWGFWGFRRALHMKSEVRVQPDLAVDRRRVASLFLTRGSEGQRPVRQVGHGRDFEKLRPFVPGDAPEDIHWKATAKRASPVTKVFQAERTQEVYVLVDASRLSGRLLEDGRSALDAFLRSALLLWQAAQGQQDRFGLVVFSRHVTTFLRANTGRTHFDACRDALVSVRPDPAPADLRELATFLGLRLRQRALLVLLTCLDDPEAAREAAELLPAIGRRHLLLVHSLAPASLGRVFPGPVITSVEELARRVAGHLKWQGLGDLSRRLGRHGIRMESVRREALVPGLVEAYLDAKRRELL